MEKRLTELEAKLSLAEDQIESLNRAVFRQQELLDLLQEQFRLLYRQVQAAQQGDGDQARDWSRDEIPPHY